MLANHSKKQSTISNFTIQIGVFIILALIAIMLNFRMIRNGIIVESDDIVWHLTWLQRFSKELSEGIWYPRWLSGTNYGYGSPTFVFYPPLVYYLGSALKLTGMSADQVLVYLYWTASFGAGMSFYLYGQTLVQKRVACLGAIVYMTAPYLAINSNSRGALAETAAIAILPLGVWAMQQAVAKTQWRLAPALFFALLALTHLPSLVLFTVFWAFYLCIIFLKQSWQVVLSIIMTVASGFGIASFYLLPAFLERFRVDTQEMTSNQGDFRLHLFGSPSFLEYDLPLKNRLLTAFILGVCLGILCAIVALILNRKHPFKRDETLKWCFLFLSTIVLMTTPGTVIWESSKTLQAVQFPWRFMGLFTLATATLSILAIESILKQRQSKLRIPLLVLILLLIAINASYSIQRVARSSPGLHALAQYYAKHKDSDFRYRRVKEIEKIITNPYANNLKDLRGFRPLLPNGQPVPEPQLGQLAVEVWAGQAMLQQIEWRSNRQIVDVVIERPSTIRIRTYYYPTWRLMVNQVPHPIKVLADGTMGVQLAPGSYRVELYQVWTSAFTGGVALAVLSSIFLYINYKRCISPKQKPLSE